MSARPTATTSLPPSMQTHATGVAAWMRLILLWAPLSVLVGVTVVGGSVTDGLTAVAAFAAAVATFVLCGSIEVHRAAKRGASPLAAGALLATDAVVVLALGAIFAGLTVAGN